jgi:hypothetical protein
MKGSHGICPVELDELLQSETAAEKMKRLTVSSKTSYWRELYRELYL